MRRLLSQTIAMGLLVWTLTAVSAPWPVSAATGQQVSEAFEPVTDDDDVGDEPTLDTEKASIREEHQASPHFLRVGMSLVIAAFSFLMLAATWRLFQKAGKPGWMSLVPVYNSVVFLRIIGIPPWWLVLTLVPFVNLFVFYQCAAALARAFGKTPAFVFGLVLLPMIFIPLLAFGDARYGHDGSVPTGPDGSPQRTLRRRAA